MNKFNILIIEDNNIVVMGIRKIYNKHFPDANIIHSENGLKALELLSKIKNDTDLPTFILLDINMHVLNGIEFLEIINKDKRLKEIDDKGMFYADDQIGFFFKEVQKIQEALNEFTLK